MVYSWCGKKKANSAISGTERRVVMSGLEALTVNNFRVVTITTIHS